MAIRVYAYDKCATCRKALAFLDRAGVEYQKEDIVTRPPTQKQLKEVLQRTGLTIKKLFNTSGQSYQAGNFGERLQKLGEAEALACLAADGKLIKRPIVLGDDFALVGFDEATYRTQFG